MKQESTPTGGEAVPVFLGVEAFADRAGLPATYIKKWLDAGKLTKRVAGRKFLIPSSELSLVEGLLAEGEATDAPTP